MGLPRDSSGLNVARFCGAIAAGFGFLALLGWALEVPFLATFGDDRIPMAPSTAVLFVLYGSVVFLRAHLPLNRLALGIGAAVTFAGALLALLLLILSILGIRPAAELLGFAAPGTLDETPVGHMSPVAASCFLLASLSFLGSLPSSSRRAWPAAAARWIAGLVLAVSCLLLLAYLFGKPLFCGGSFIPPAATASLAFAALGVALLELAGRPVRPPASPTAASRKGVPRRLVLIVVLVAASIVSAGGLYSRAETRRLRTEFERQLTAVAELKASELTQWRLERLGDASLLLNNAVFSGLVRHLLDDSPDAAAPAQLRIWLTKMHTHYLYDQISVLDSEGSERLAIPNRRRPVSSGIASRVPEILRTGGVTFEDFYRDERDNRIYLSLLVPIFDEHSRALGIVVLTIDPQTYLYPFLQRWPTPAQTAETLLIRRDGNDALFLNELKFQQHTALTLRVPLANSNEVAVMAALGTEGIVEGRDDRGVRVLAALRAIPDSPWTLVARIDSAEADAPLRERLWEMIVLLGALLAAAVAAVGVAWREIRVRDLRGRYEAERERAWLHDVIALSLNEVYVFDSATLRFRFVNRGACRNLGYTPEELAGLTPLDIKPELTAEGFRALLEPLRTAERPKIAFESIHRRKDGSDYPVEVHLQLVDSGGTEAFLAVASDITESRRAETRIRKLNRVYAVLSDVNQSIVRVRESTALFAEACRIAVETGGFRMAWVGLLDAKTNSVRPVAHAGVTDGYLEKLQIELGAGDGSRERGPTGSAVREGVRAVCNDIEHDPRMTAWRDDALALGYRASAAFPLMVKGEILGAFNLYASEPGFFDAEELRLLDELATDLSFAMEVGQREETRLLLAAAIEQSPVSVTITDADGRIEYVNPAFTQITGYPREEALGSNPRMLKSGKQEPALYQELWTSIRAGRSWQGELVNRHKDGSLYTQELTITPIREAAGRVAHFVAVSQDVTERRRVEASLRASENRYRTLFDRNLAGVYRSTLDGRILECNEAFAGIFGYSSRTDALAGSAYVLYPTPADRADFLATLQSAGAVVNRESEGRRQDGRSLWLLENAHVIDGSEAAEGKVIEGTLLDITERKNLETELRQSQKIEAIGRLAGGVAHDFNNILGVILGYGELVQSELTAESPVREYVAEMVEAAQRAATLTRQLQAFSRKQVLQPRRLDLNELVATAHKMLDRVIGEDIALVVRAAAELGTVLADPGQIDQVLLNLAINARDAMPAGGTLTLETADVDLREVDATTDRPAIKPGRYVMVAVSDTGVGMDAETQRRLFEPFFTTKPVGQGTGLGLATVYGIVKQSGGYIWVYSEPGLGTTFKIYLPQVDEQPDDNRPGVALADVPGGSETILVVEDNLALRSVTWRRLAASGYTVLLAVDGEAALALADTHPEPIDLLLTDVVMPNLGGAELARRLGALRPGLRVLFMSGYTDGAIVQHGVLEEGVVLLEKPFSGERLLRAVREVLDRPPRVDGAQGPERPERAERAERPERPERP